MRVLLTNNTLNARAGSELYVYDVATELLRRGHQPVAFSTDLGQVAAQLRDATIPVVDDLRRIGAPPDIIHGQHHFETLLAVLAFPDTPAINFCHGWAPWEEQPLLHPRVLRYVAVDHVCRDRLELEHGIPPNSIRVILNSVDTARFRPRPPLPLRPKRALAFGNAFDGRDSEILRAACSSSGIQLDVAGLVSGQPAQAPEKLLSGYEIVFAKARAALEAMAVGAAVILCGPRGLGPMVIPEEWDRLRIFNFGVRTLTLPLTSDTVLSQIQRYDAHSAAVVSARTRQEATLESTADQLVQLYQEVMDEHSRMSSDPGDSQRAAARYLRHHAGAFKGRANTINLQPELLQLHEELGSLREHCEELEHRDRARKQLEEQLQLTVGESESECAKLYGEMEEARNRVRDEAKRRCALETELKSVVAGAAQHQEQLARCMQELQVIEESATWRIARAILQSAPANACAPLVDRIGKLIRDRYSP